MADWTPADDQRLAELEAQARELEDQVEGDPHAEAHVSAIRETHRGPMIGGAQVSTIRAVLGAGRDILNDTLKTGRAFIEQASRSRITGRQTIELGNGDIIPDIAGSEEAPMAEKIVRQVGSFLVPYAGWAKKLKVAEAGLGIGQRILRGAGAGFATDFIHQNPEVSNMASVVKDTFGLDNQTLDFLTYNADDPELVQRLKAATTNLPVGVAADGLFELGAKAIRGLKSVKDEPDAAKGIVEALEHDYGVKRIKREPTSVDAEAGAIEAPIKPAEEPFDSGIHVAIREANPQSWEDILSFLERKVDDPNLKDEELAELARILRDDPENALARIGIDPAKLDYAAFANPQGITNLQRSLINIYEKVGNRLGRTGTRVSESEIHIAARSMASEAEVLDTLYGNTKNLPEILMASRLFVGGHAHTLLDQAEQTLEALTKEGPQAEALWQKFLEAFHRHALYLGTLRGAGSEIARALRSLRMIAHTDPKGAAKLGEEIKIPEALSPEAAEEAAEDIHKGVLAIKDDGEKIMLLNKLLDKEGDIGELSLFVRQKALSPLKRADGVLREGVSNLFSLATAAYNVKAGLSMMALRGLGRWMAAFARLPLAALSPEQARLARIAFADAWAYTDGALFSVNEALRVTMNEIDRHAAEELYINADHLGLKNVAKAAAKRQAELRKLSRGKNFERIDMDASHMQFAITPADRRELAELMESESLPSIAFRGMQFMAKAVGANINALGTINRLGTILFINAPDQFIGTMAARAGAQSAAVRDAAVRAAELGIEGKDLTRYLKARVGSLPLDVDGWADDGFRAGQEEVENAIGQHERRRYTKLINDAREGEARAVLFQDQIESKSMRGISRAISNAPVVGTLVVPFAHTPIRILERSLVDFTPLGLLKHRVRQAILHGTPQAREQALSQMGLGMLTMALAWHLSEDRGIVATDGSFTSTARLNRESFTARIGGDVYEFVRDDPLGTIIGLTVDARAAFQHLDQDDPEYLGKANAIWEAGLWAVTANILSKSYLQSLKNLADVFGYSGDETTGWDRYIRQTVARRIVPGAGLQKGLEAPFDPFERAAYTFQEEMLKNSLLSSTLPERNDFLGDPELKNLGERFIGLTWKPENPEPLVQELDRMSIQTRLPQRDIEGVPLSGEQFNRLLKLRGQEVSKPGQGPMKEALEKLIELPEYQALTDPAKETQIRSVMEGYTKLAKAALLEEDPELHARVIRKKAYDDARASGLRQDELRKQNEALGQALGLTQ